MSMMDEMRGEVPFRVRFALEHERARVMVQIEPVREQQRSPRNTDIKPQDKSTKENKE
jgi:hypothetical protein